jgi:hypothetical protein
MIRWLPFERDNTVYPLEHLHPQTVIFRQPAKGDNPERTYTVDIEFGLHCFTCEPLEGDDPKLLYSDARETRRFDLYRYNLSMRLPDFVESLPTRKCYHTEHGNFFTIEILGDAGQKPEQYEVYFTVSKSARKGVLNLSLQSAYVRDRAFVKRKKPVGFFVILHNTLNDRPIHPAP